MPLSSPSPASRGPTFTRHAVSPGTLAPCLRRRSVRTIRTRDAHARECRETANRTQRATLHASSSGVSPPSSTGDVPRWTLRCSCHCRCSCSSRSCSRLVRYTHVRPAPSFSPPPSLSVGATARPPAARRQPRHPPPRRPVRRGQDCALLQAARRRRAGQRRRAADRHRAVDGRERGAAGSPPRLRSPPASGRPARPSKTESKAGRRGWTLLRGGVRCGREGGRLWPLRPGRG